VRPSRRREMAHKVVSEQGVCIRVACVAFRISESCYRYERKLDAENEEVASWLIKLTDNHRSWGFGLCYLYLRNVKGFKWNHKRVYQIYKEQELNLRIKPLPRSGCSLTNMTAKTWPIAAWAGSHPSRDWPWLLNVSTSATLAKGEDYHNEWPQFLR
jgi:hypothetical protein